MVDQMWSEGAHAGHEWKESGRPVLHLMDREERQSHVSFTSRAPRFYCLTYVTKEAKGDHNLFFHVLSKVLVNSSSTLI